MTENPHSTTPISPPTQEMREYWEALGQFIHYFAQVEAFLVHVLIIKSGVTIPIGRAIFSGARIDTLRDFINRIHSVTKRDPNMVEDFKNISDELGNITRVRNDIVHYGTKFDEGDQFLVTNQHIALTEERVRETPVSVKKLQQIDSRSRKDQPPPRVSPH